MAAAKVTGGLVLFAFLFSGCGLTKKKECLEEEGKEPEECEDMRVVEESGQMSLVRGDFNVRFSSGAFNPEFASLELFRGDVQTCGGTLVSKVFKLQIRDSEGQLKSRRQLGQKAWARHNLRAVLPERDSALHLVIARDAAAPARWFSVGPTVLEPQGAAAEGKTDVNFWTLETDALFYLVSAPSLSAPCEVYPSAEELEKFPDEPTAS